MVAVLNVFSNESVYPRMCGVDSLVFNVLNAIQGLLMQISYLFYRGIVLGF